MLRNPDGNPALGVNIRRNVSRMKRLKALFETENPPDLGGQYAPEYPRRVELQIQLSPTKFSIPRKDHGYGCLNGFT